MSPPPGGARLRAAAARAVDAVTARGQSLDAALRDAELETPPDDRPLLWTLSYGTLRHHWRLKAWLELLLTRPLKRRDHIVESLLAVGLYQLLDSRVPAHASVSLTVEAARLLRRPQHAGLVNACLRNFERRGLRTQAPATDEARYDHPAWLIDRLRAAWPSQWERILAAGNERAPMWLRVNVRRTTAAGYLERLPPGATTLAGFDGAIRLAAAQPAAGLPGYNDGLVSVQDAAAQLAAPWLLQDGGRRVLDACAAPGGKTAQLLELAPPGLALTAVDVDPDRLAAARDNLGRLRLTARLVAGDAAEPGAWWDGEPFDRILLDAPCSATGVIRRHPDIRLLRRAADIAGLALRQRRLLEALWPLLAPGGRLLYVTCSVLPEENTAVTADFLAAHPDAGELSVLPNYNIRDVMCRQPCGWQILPGNADLDGFYYACLAKRAERTT